MVAVVLCLAVDSYFIYSVLEIDFCKRIKNKTQHEFSDKVNYECSDRPESMKPSWNES